MKTERIVDFLARGGKIKSIESTPIVEKRVVKSSTITPLSIITLEEAALFYSENNDEKTSNKEPKVVTDIDPALIPDDLKDLLGAGASVESINEEN